MMESTARRSIPSLDRLLREPRAGELIDRYGRTRIVDAARLELAAARAEGRFDEASFFAACGRRLAAGARSSMRRVFNLTGTVLHTNLGRALMPRSAVDAVAEAMTRPVNLEFDVDGGERGERDRHVEGLLLKLTGAEAAVVVNNNAAAVYLVLNTLAVRREVPVSRGELVEIGGSFRIPDIMSRAGTRLVEVGTTNRTHARDYEDAITPRTAALMKVHASNYSIGGFTATVGENELALLARGRGLAMIADLGSGTLVDLAEFGLPHEPTPREAITAGVDVVTFSGDKLLGGPQAGLIVGKRMLLDRIRRNPMKRALRVDKMTLAALEAVLRLYENPERLKSELPTMRFLTRSDAEIAAQARRVLPAIRAALGDAAKADIVAVRSQIGSGSLPVDLIASYAIAIDAEGKHRGSFAAAVAQAFRVLPVPVVGRVSDGRFLMDLRCLENEDDFAAQLPLLKLEPPS